MRWAHPRHAETRVVTRFLLFPRVMRNVALGRDETRWLEQASWVQVYRDCGDNWGWDDDHWVTLAGKQ